ncbi:MAG: copper amine oxidase N-terminal domain-containing protein [Defluviitaleaceae bacterium]|nr:copper amine oxidase N-terminal domain-containing protein [Defluviitaleaceae bacterium]
MRRLTFGLILAVVLVFTPAAALMADFNITLDDAAVEIAMEVRYGRTLVPVRAFVQGILGGEVDWCGTARRVYINHAHNALILHIDSDIALVNGDEVMLDVPAKIINDATLVPLRFVVEALGMGVTFDDGSIRLTGGHIQIVDFTHTVRRGSDAALQIIGRPYTYYHLGVQFLAGASTAAGLGYAKTDQYGNVYWNWRIGSLTTPGLWPITISGGGQVLREYFEVVTE